VIAYPPAQDEVLGKLATGVSIDAARRVMAQAFRSAGLDSPDLDARILTGHALALDHTALASSSERKATGSEIAAIAQLARRRLGREPVARITGRKEFWGLELRVTPATLVPRPETETVVEAVLAAIGDKSRALRMADFGTGTGALLLALLSELPNTSGIGTDINAEALVTAQANANYLGLAQRAEFVLCDYGAALHGPFDLVVSNPPYIASGDIAALAPEVRDYDPRLALDGGASGLDGYRAVVADARRILAPKGILVVELGAGQAPDVAALFHNGGFATEPPRADFSGHFRALLGRLSRA
jgi:release factor glutamine methyltransferase